MSTSQLVNTRLVVANMISPDGREHHKSLSLSVHKKVQVEHMPAIPSIREIASELNIARSFVHRIAKKDLKLDAFCRVPV